MLMRGRSKVLWMAAIVPLLAAAVLPTRFQTLVCRFTGVVMDFEVCCPSDSERGRESPSQLFGENCCVLKTINVQRLVTESRTDDMYPRDHRVLVAAPFVRTFELVRYHAHAHQVRPPPIGPPLLLVKHSFLI